MVNLFNSKHFSGFLFDDIPSEYVCDICSKTFHHPESFSSHRKFHSGHTTCRHCNHQFSTVGTLNRHIRKVHKVEPKIRPEIALDFSKTQPILYNSLNYK